MLKLYFAPNTSALAPRIALEEAGAPHEIVRLNLAAGAQRAPEYLAINPKGRVPALATERGVISENPAILVYIAQRFPAARLAPLDDPFAFAEVQAFNAYLCATVHPAHAHGRRGERWADDPAAIAELKRKVPETVGACFELIERALFRGPWAMGRDYTICDPYLFTIARWLESDRVDAKRFPRILDHRERMAARPAVKRALADEAASQPPP